MSSETDDGYDDSRDDHPNPDGDGDGGNADNCGCHTPPEHPDCDPDLIDHLKCQAEGIAAQAKYNEETRPALEQGSEDYAKTRTDYRVARAAAAVEVQDLRHQVKQLVERIRCQIQQDRVIECLDRAFRHICRRLDKCDDGGCCSTGPCDFDKTCPDDYDELVSRIAEYQARLDRDKECFTTLTGEPAKLTARVAAVKAEIDEINAGLAGDQATVDLKRLYVATLVAQLHLSTSWIWNGFDDTQAFVDCLCRALTCWTKASDAISALTGCKAIMDCQKADRQKRCEDLRTKTTEEVLLEYERLCSSGRCKHQDPNDSCDDKDDSDDGEETHDQGGGYEGGDGHKGDDDAPCGCNHGHPHGRGHHRHPHHHDGGEA
jgi:hypothetical protein